MLAAARNQALPETVEVGNRRHYDLGSAHGVGLAITDAIRLQDGRLLASAAAEASANPRDDGPVVGSALVLLDEERVSGAAPIPLVEGSVAKVEGLMRVGADDGETRVLAVVDVDDPETPSLALRLRLRLRE